MTRMRDQFKSKEHNALRWITITRKVADALSKQSPNLSIALNRMMFDGVWSLGISQTTVLNPETWL